VTVVPVWFTRFLALFVNVIANFVTLRVARNLQFSRTVR